MSLVSGPDNFGDYMVAGPKDGNGEDTRQGSTSDETPTVVIVPGLTSDSSNHVRNSTLVINLYQFLSERSRRRMTASPFISSYSPCMTKFILFSVSSSMSSTLREVSLIRDGEFWSSTTGVLVESLLL